MTPLSRSTIFKFAGPGKSDLSALGELLVGSVCRELPHVFTGFHGIYASNYNLKKVAVSRYDNDGVAIDGRLDWAVTLMMSGAFYKRDAYLRIEFDADNIYMPALFRDQLGNVYPITDAGVTKFLTGDADLDDHLEPFRPVK